MCLCSLHGYCNCGTSKVQERRCQRQLRTRPKVSPLRMQSPSLTDHSVFRSASMHLNTCCWNTHVRDLGFKLDLNPVTLNLCELRVRAGSEKKHQSCSNVPLPRARGVQQGRRRALESVR